MVTQPTSPQSTDILIIRHGQTDWNRLKRLQGHSDVPLNDEGRRQAAVLAALLRHEALDAIFSSDLARAYQTAEEIARLHRLPVQPDASFRERCYGACEGMPVKDIEKTYPEAYKAWCAADPDHFFPDGERKTESPRQFHQRASAAIRRLAARHPGGKIVLVTHFGVIETAYRLARGIPLGTPCKMPVFNTGINRFRLTGNHFELITWGEASHLEEARKPVDYYGHF